MFFPSLSSTADTKELYTQLKKEAILILQGVQGKGNFNDEILKIQKYFAGKLKPKSYGGKNGLEIKTIKGFEETCILLSQNGVSDSPKRMTTLSFYQALETIKAQQAK